MSIDRRTVTLRNLSMNASSTSRRIVITGAGSGLGRAIAMRFAAEGWRVAVTDVELRRAEATLAAIVSAGGDGISICCDVRNDADFRAVADQLDQAWSGVDVVINNAGVGSAGTVTDTSAEDWLWTMDINLMGVVRGCRLLSPLLVRQNSGHIVNIASFAGIANAPAMAAYNTAKAGVIGLSETLRAEMAPHHVGVSVACPSFFRTNLMEDFRSPDPRLRAMAEKMFKRARVTAQDVADDIFDAVRRNRFMIITHSDARWLYRLKRMAPETFYKLVARRAASFAAPGKKR